MLKTATISPCGKYRYTLRRIWDHALPPCYWIMLNPSTADDKEDDPTIRRVIGFSRSWGCGSADVFNLFALRATDPMALQLEDDPVGPENDHHLSTIAKDRMVVAAWGTWGDYRSRALAMRRMFDGRLICLGTTKDGHPRHPLYVRADAPRVPYPLVAAQSSPRCEGGGG